MLTRSGPLVMLEGRCMSAFIQPLNVSVSLSWGVRGRCRCDVVMVNGKTGGYKI